MPNLLCMNPKHWLTPNKLPSTTPDAELRGNFFIGFSPNQITWKLLLWSSVSMFRITELRELEVLFSVRRGQREIYGKESWCYLYVVQWFKNIQNNSIWIREWIERNMKVSLYSFPISKWKKNEYEYESREHKWLPHQILLHDHFLPMTTMLESSQWHGWEKRP